MRYSELNFMLEELHADNGHILLDDIEKILKNTPRGMLTKFATGSAEDRAKAVGYLMSMGMVFCQVSALESILELAFEGDLT